MWEEETDRAKKLVQTIQAKYKAGGVIPGLTLEARDSAVVMQC